MGTLLVLLLGVFCTALEEARVPVFEPPIRLKGDFVPFGMCMGTMKPSDQVAYCRRAGFPGLGLQDMDRRVLREFAELPDVASGAFKIHSTLWWTNVSDTLLDTAWFDGVLEEARKMDLAIWMVVDGPDKSDKSKSRAVSMISKASVRCGAKGVRLVLYPHGGCVVSSAEEGMEILDSLRRRGRDNVRLSIHLCHELKAGNGRRIAEVVRKAASFLELASVSGADSDTYRRNDDNWASAIKPLDRGDYDPRPFLRALSEIGYSGPIELHTYNLKSPRDPGYDRHLERSRAKWTQIVSQGE